MLDRRAERDARVQRDAPDRLSKAVAVNRIYSDGHVHRIDRDNLIVHVYVIDIAIRKTDVTGVHIERDDRRIVDHVGRIQEPNKRTYSLRLPPNPAVRRDVPRFVRGIREHSLTLCVSSGNIPVRPRV